MDSNHHKKTFYSKESDTIWFLQISPSISPTEWA